jgi:enamine deaminase RidA (YjgF/YER057c/UK114 family)
MNIQIIYSLISAIFYPNRDSLIKTGDFTDQNCHHRMDENTAEQKLAHWGLILPPAPSPMGVYKPCLVDGRYLYVSGHGPVQDDGSLIIGRVGQDLDIEQGKAAARQAGLAILATIRTHLGSLDKVRRVIKILGMVGCVPEFDRHPYVINGCSELFAAIWGEDNGVGVRSAIGVGSLPNNIPVEIEALFELY